MELTERILGVANARVRGMDGLWDIEVQDGRIASVLASRGGERRSFLNAGGRLITEPFVVAHLHLDKVMTASRLSSAALAAYQLGRMDTKKSIKLASKVKEGYTEGDIVSRAKPLIEEALRNGVTGMRAFADTDTVSELKAVRALMRLRNSFAGKMAIQVVAFPQEGIESDPGAEEYVERAMELGADVVGGIPWLERDNPRRKKHIDKMFSIARRHDKPVAMLVDDAGNPELRTLEMLALKTIEEGMQGKVQACHARAMQVYSERYARRVALLCARAGLGVVSSPHTGPLHARIDLLTERGVTVALGQDDCSDAYYPYGRCNMLEVAFLASHILRMMTRADLESLYDMITINPARIIGLGNRRLAPGGPANFVVLSDPDLVDVLAIHRKPLAVFNGDLLVYNEPRTG